MWLAIGTGPDEFHVIPHDDLIEHTENDECVCGPSTTYLDDGLKMIMHASLDGRERREPDWKS
jgi:hypothetical protein